MRIALSFVVSTSLLLAACGGQPEQQPAPEAPASAPTTPAPETGSEGQVSQLAGPYFYARDSDEGRRLVVGAQSLTVYLDWGGTCTLSNPQSFTVKDAQGEWVWGFAWGNCNAHGWVQNGWFFNIDA